ncbi:uncharacterized protein RMCC_1608 [Mycolicibacterium canariasense]|uniref:DUF8021 domain-containing protein n=1 Tax=Mycolicibacterium canariasense TaxID=228230 RepID=A0A100WA03_MYCCR|nr:hypothetical protein [Mycolicibacterium canariasense]MCV7208572.1 hypothetical protein [Mycolicibacterium canariasense]ORV07331.1 hypothetical protein AWB94_15265 [Mycolicibacterium canariasense]GAS94642.1 uncharacterized protein RMCC_1608 [Mycolicibacterium canariasense]
MPATEADRIAAAQAYIDALVTHRADEVPFAPGCIRIEMGVKTGRSGDHLRRSLNNGPQFKIIEATTPPEFSVDGDHVRARFDVLTKPRLLGRRVCSHVDETFLIPESDGLIHHINAKLTPFIGR